MVIMLYWQPNGAFVNELSMECIRGETQKIFPNFDIQFLLFGIHLIQ